MRQDLKEIAEQVASEWEQMLDKMSDPDNVVRLSINAAIQQKLVEYAIDAISQKTADVAESVADKAVDRWIENGEFTSALPDVKVKKQIEKVFLLSDKWPEHVLTSAKHKLATVHRLMMVEGMSVKIIANQYKITVQEAERLVEKAQDHADHAREMYEAFWGK